MRWWYGSFVPSTKPRHEQSVGMKKNHFWGEHDHFRREGHAMLHKISTIIAVCLNFHHLLMDWKRYENSIKIFKQFTDHTVLFVSKLPGFSFLILLIIRFYALSKCNNIKNNKNNEAKQLRQSAQIYKAMLGGQHNQSSKMTATPQVLVIIGLLMLFIMGTFQAHDFGPHYFINCPHPSKFPT